MAELPDHEQQVLYAHGQTLRLLVMSVHDREHMKQLEPVLKASEANGWGELVGRFRRILKGERDESLLLGLDDEDRAIVHAALKALQDPSYLNHAARPDASMAAPGLAGMIHRASTGDATALQVLAGMAEQMVQAGGDMARVGGNVRRLIDGERDPEILCKDMGAQGESLMLSILKELGRLAAH